MAAVRGTAVTGSLRYGWRGLTNRFCIPSTGGFDPLQSNAVSASGRSTVHVVQVRQ